MDENSLINDDNKTEYYYRLFEMSNDGVKINNQFSLVNDERIILEPVFITAKKFASITYVSNQTSKLTVYEDNQIIKTYAFDYLVQYVEVLDHFILVSNINQITLIDLDNNDRYEKTVNGIYRLYDPCIINSNLVFTDIQGKLDGNGNVDDYTPYLLKAEKGKLIALNIANANLGEYAKICNKN